MPKFTRLLSSKKRLAIISTGAIAGFLFVTRALGSAPVCSASCRVPNNPTYHRLQQNEAVFKVDHPRISSVYVNYLPSNSPNEDRHVIGGWKEDCTGLFGVIDGHKSSHCSEHLKNVLLKHVTSVFVEENIIDSSEVTEYSARAKNPFKSPNEDAIDTHPLIQLKPEVTDQCTLREGVEEVLQNSFVSLDNKISEEALKCVKLVNKGRSIKEEGMIETIMKAVAGACALLSLVSADDIFVASTGDCRAVLGIQGAGSHDWKATPMSIDQNAQNKEEVNRLKHDHPGEEDTVIIHDRLLGGLMPFRSFGDVDYKWEDENVKVVMNGVPYYKTPPYLTAEPVVTRRVMEGNERFLILATDGLWDKLSNENAVKVVGGSLYGEKVGFFSRQKEQCCEDGGNPATSLLWTALGGDETKVQDMLDAPKKYRRMYRDDITIIVIQFK